MGCARGLDEGFRRGAGPFIHFLRPEDVGGDAPTVLQNAFSTAPMIVQPITEFTPSITVSAGFRIEKA